MSYKVCYVTTIAGSIRNFILDSALYNIEHADWDVTFVCDYDEEFKCELSPNIHYNPISIHRGYDLTDINAIFKLKKLFKKEKFDLIEFATTKAAFYASIAAKQAHIPIRLYGQWGISYTTYTGLKGIVVKTIEKIISSNATHVYGVCNENLERAISDRLYDHKKGFVVGYGSSLGVDLNRFDISMKQQWRKEIRKKYGISDSTFVFGYVGMLRKEKGLEELFAASKGIFKKYGNAVCFIVGDTRVVEGIAPEIYKWAQNTEKIVFTGFTNEVQKYFAAMDCFVFPSYHEGFGNVTIEAEAMGVPVIATDIPGTREAMLKDKTGVTVPVKDSMALEKAIEKLMQNPELLQSYGKCSREYVSEYFDKEKLCQWIFENRMSLLKKENL